MDWIQFRRSLHQIPEPGFEEFKTQRFLLNYIESLPQERLTIRTWRTGIFVRVRGTNPKQTIGYRTDMDGLAVDEHTGLPFASKHEGMMHACGHDMHMTIAARILTEIVTNPVEDNVLFVFQPAEEGPGGAKPMLESDEFVDLRPDVMLALHVAPEYPVGTIATRPGILFANTSELWISLVGQGGHAAYPHRSNDMVVAAAHLVTQLQSVVARNVDPLDAAVVTVGKIIGGTRQNIIAERARLEGTIRTLSADSMVKIKGRIDSILRGIEAGFQCEATVDYGSNYVQVYNHENVTDDFMRWLQDTGEAELVVCQEAMTGEDFGYFLAEIPGMMFWLGVDTPYGLHHSKMNPSEDAVEVAARVVTGYIRHLSRNP
ncbi:N-acetyldiaminopimelate deacetylase [Alicyclobacillus sp. SO9]|uniref:N-acetyldiaminopimelate deacetylase n=1 Tax=Alicyclobacillus sp. SO9 TaxID=2665646 RepID=UPI00351C6E60